ncbi:MAG: Mur ligase family protein, partial [Patescibacteria group bacterium]
MIKKIIKKITPGFAISYYHYWVAFLGALIYGFPSRKIKVIGITGTNGKTSSAWWLAQALSAAPEGCAVPCGMIGTLGVGCPPVAGAAPTESALSAIQSTGLTTPDPV